MRARAPPVNGRKRPLSKHKEKGRMANAPRAPRAGIPHSPALFLELDPELFPFRNCYLHYHLWAH